MSTKTQTAMPDLPTVAVQHSPKPRFPLVPCVLSVLAIMACTALLELLMGRSPLSQSGAILLWVGNPNSPENSQQFTDWYTLSHFLHGFLFYGLIRLLSRGQWPLVLCLLLAVTLEGSWEILENSSFIINRYRTATIAVGYTGDSILNSMSDLLFCLLGFLTARYLPLWSSLLLFVGLELGMAYAIHDNLTLNILMLLHPLETIKQWQMNLGALLL